MTEERPLRADARRNRERLVEAARTVFAARGLDAPLEDIARQAGVSIGTLYNRFPTRDALIDAACADQVAATAAIAAQALSYDDAWEGFVHFVTRICDLQAADRGYRDLTGRTVRHSAQTRAALRDGYRQMLRIVRRAQRAGALRADVTLADLAFVFWGHAATVAATTGIGTHARHRHLALMLDGLRAEGAHPLPAPPLSPAEVDRALGGCD
ncbi:TetR/AcrR family transcriptional regulator [Actinocatenispora comari]|jgi:AcrR family transcriptional regulator|uniref:TetR family transcriptional regulator n=1 Tax=Actinocatenispora comari TaxID=2807577 RepID=A0A8J4EK33_9ACTN|nr:TetR/AcrR family transcriptional regulator [Actinocatenispora comari]GIL26453.1 TetR family transcriptional regulator [Actinocatenispora comari]